MTIVIAHVVTTAVLLCLLLLLMFVQTCGRVLRRPRARHAVGLAAPIEPVGGDFQDQLAA